MMHGSAKIAVLLAAMVIAIPARMPLFIGAATAQSGSGAQDLNETNSLAIVEGYPPKIARSIEQRQRRLNAAATSNKARQGAFSSVVIASFRRWVPGSTVRVAFEGGNEAVLQKIEQAAKEWTLSGRANLNLSFRDAEGKFRKWGSSDRIHNAEIRVSFRDDGYWSLVGRDSISRDVLGGGPGEASMNLEGFDSGLPPDWALLVRHEFGHALGFQHEHQHPAVECGFRFDDDPGYVRIPNADGVFTPDSAGRRPGLYTFFGGEPNKWDPETVDFNLRRITQSTGYPISYFDLAAYDPESIMGYFFEPAMFVERAKSPCYKAKPSAVFSKGDIVAMAKAYPAGPELAAALERQALFVRLIEQSNQASRSLRVEASIHLDSIEAR